MKYDDDLDWKEKLLMIVVALLMLWIMFFGLNSLVSAADSISRWVTKAQIDQAVEDGAIQRTSNEVRGNELEVVNNYGEQSTIDTNQLQGSRNE